jgi:hypothetical protein
MPILSSRAARRLEIARDMLRLGGDLDTALRHIRSMKTTDRDGLRAAVDWVEGYERAETKMNLVADSTKQTQHPTPA